MMKVHGKRKIDGDPVRDITAIQRMINYSRKDHLVPRGLYRFNSFEEAEEWMTTQMVRLQIAEEKKK